MIALPLQDPSKPVFSADSDFVPLLLTFVANESKREEAMVTGAQNVYKDRKSPKGYGPRSPAWSGLHAHLDEIHAYTRAFALLPAERCALNRMCAACTMRAALSTCCAVQAAAADADGSARAADSLRAGLGDMGVQNQ